MRFRCEKQVLSEAVSATARATSSRAQLRVLSGIRLVLEANQLTLTGSDLDMSVNVTVDVDGQQDGTVVLPAKLLTDITKTVGAGAVTVAVEGVQATIEAGRSQFTVLTIPAVEFPNSTLIGGDGIKLDAKLFGQALHQVTPAASTDDSRPILTGVFFEAEGEGLRMVATDSYRLAIRDLPGVSLGETGSVLIPASALRELHRLIGSASEVTVRFGERDATFEVGNTILTTRLIEGEFPAYRNLIPASPPQRLTVGRSVLSDAVRRVKVMAADASTPVKFDLAAETVALSTTSTDVGSANEQVDAKYEGTDLEVAFNPEYLLAGLDAIADDEITFDLTDGLKPVLVRGCGDSDFTYLVMPIRIG